MKHEHGIDRMVILIVSGRQADELMGQLRQHGFYFTVVDSSGGVFQESTESLLIGLPGTRMNALLALVRQYCQPQKMYIPAQLNIPPNYTTVPMIEAQMGGALFYALNVERFEQI